MHVLHRPHLPRAVAVTAVAALLAVILTLAIASGLSDRAYAPASANAPRAAVTVRPPAARPGPSASPFTRSPFTTLLTAPVTLPWRHAR